MEKGSGMVIFISLVINTSKSKEVDLDESVVIGRWLEVWVAAPNFDKK